MKSLMLSTLVLFLAVPSWSAHVVDTGKTSITWKGTKKLGSFHTGGIGVKEGKIETNAKGEITGGTIVIDMTTITNEDLKSDPKQQKRLVGHLSSADFFNVEKYPTATFKITGSEKKSGKTTLLKGDLTLLGVTQKVEVPATIQTSKNGLSGEATIQLDRTKWGLKYGSGNIFKELTADKIINDQIELKVKLETKKS